MRLVDDSVKGFAEALGSDAPVPGGGCAAALQGALGASLARMVAALTAGRAKYAEHSDFVAELLAALERLQGEFINAIDEDKLAFDEFSLALALPKETPQEKAARKLAMGAALKSCARAPMRVMELALEALELVERAVGKTNANAASDLGVAALSLKASIQGSWLNVLTNLGGTGDETFNDDFRQKGRAIMERALPAADRAYEAILKSL